MVAKQPISDQRIINCLNIKYGIKVTSMILIPLGADINASVYKAQTDDQSSYFVKLKHGFHNDIGLIIQQLLHDAGIQQIICPIKTNYDQPTYHIDDFTFTVYPFIKGQDGFSRYLTNDQWIILGKTLRQFHEFNVPPLIKNKIKQESFSPKWRDPVRSIYTYIDTEKKRMTRQT